MGLIRGGGLLIYVHVNSRHYGLIEIISYFFACLRILSTHTHPPASLLQNAMRATSNRSMVRGYHYVLLLVAAYALVALSHDVSGEWGDNEHRVLASSERACDTTDCAKSMDSAKVTRGLFNLRRRRRLMTASLAEGRKKGRKGGKGRKGAKKEASDQAKVVEAVKQNVQGPVQGHVSPSNTCTLKGHVFIDHRSRTLN